MAEKVKLSKDGNSIDFVQSESLPTSLKKFRQSPEIEGFYRFIFENDLQKEAYEILDRIVNARKAAKKAQKTEIKAAAKLEAQAVAAQEKQAKVAAQEKAKAKPVPAAPKVAAAKVAVVKPAVKPVVKPTAKVAPNKASAKPTTKPAGKKPVNKAPAKKKK